MIRTSCLAIALTCLGLGELPAQAQQEPKAEIIIEAPGIMQGDIFHCRIPVRIRSTGPVELTHLNVIAKAYMGDAELASTGIATGQRPLVIDRADGAWIYRPVPLQFELTEYLCARTDGIRIVLARCTFGDGRAENCLDRIRFAGADEKDPHYLPLNE